MSYDMNVPKATHFQKKKLYLTIRFDEMIFVLTQNRCKTKSFTIQIQEIINIFQSLARFDNVKTHLIFFS